MDNTHVNYPHEPGRLHDCPACEAACHCTPGTAECVFEGEHPGQRVWALWYGGASYAQPYLAEHLEIFESIEDALDALREREHSNGRSQLTVRYANGTEEYVYFPVVEGSSLEIFYADPREDTDAMPDARWELDPEGDAVETTHQAAW
jgi:hypothetical protein